MQSTVSGGAEAYLNRLYSQGTRGVSTTLFGALPGWEGARHDLGLSPKWGKRTIAQGLTRLPAERRRLTSAVRKDPQDGFHLQFKREQLGFTGPLSRIAPVIWTEHGRMTPVFQHSLGHWYRAAARYTSAITCVSAEVADDVRSVVGSCPLVEVIENAVDTHRYRPATARQRADARALFGIDPQVPVLAWVGRLHPNKLPGLALDVAEQWPGHTLIAGTGPELGRIETRVGANPRIHILGHTDPRPVYAAADVFMLTSTGEGFPTTVLEAASCGLSTVSNAGSATSRVVAESAGETLPDDAPPSVWVKALSEAARTEHGDQARAWALQHSLDSWRRKHLELLQSLL